MVKLQVSVCKTFSKSKCNPPSCSYVNGTKRQYCRTRKKSKFGIKSESSQSESELILNEICPDTGMCLAFGNCIDQLNKYFHGFTNFDYTISPINRIGIGNSGFIHEINYDNNGYKASSILKSAMKNDSDNLVYEYLVGVEYINHILKLFPCFVETYGLYYYDTPESWILFKNTDRLDSSNLQHLILQNNVNYIKACTESKSAACLIQHINKAYTIYDLYTSNDFLKFDLVFVLFIIYHALSSLTKTFTHYDLHSNNVLMYQPNGQVIEYHYHYSDGTSHSFYSLYIPKIIDYGRSFFNNGNISSHKIYKTICNTKECDHKCGNNVGFKWLSNYGRKKDEITDIRLLNDVKHGIMDNLLPGIAINDLKRLLYGIGKPVDNIIYENLTPTTFSRGASTNIYNLTVAFTALKYIVSDPDVLIENRNTFSQRRKIGDLHVYDDGRPMKFEKNSI